MSYLKVVFIFHKMMLQLNSRCKSDFTFICLKQPVRNLSVSASIVSCCRAWTSTLIAVFSEKAVELWFYRKHQKCFKLYLQPVHLQYRLFMNCNEIITTTTEHLNGWGQSWDHFLWAQVFHRHRPQVRSPLRITQVTNWSLYWHYSQTFSQ